MKLQLIVRDCNVVCRIETPVELSNEMKEFYNLTEDGFFPFFEPTWVYIVPRSDPNFLHLIGVLLEAEVHK